MERQCLLQGYIGVLRQWCGNFATWEYISKYSRLSLQFNVEHPWWNFYRQSWSKTRQLFRPTILFLLAIMLKDKRRKGKY